MKVFEPRKRIALDVGSIEDPEVKESINQLAELQKDVGQLNNGLSTQIRAAEAELQTMLNRMKEADQKLTQLLDSIKAQTQSLVNAALQYIQMNQLDLSEQTGPKFRDSFVYMMKDAVSNLQQIVNGLQNQAGSVLTQSAEVPEDMDVEVESEVVSPPMSPEPSSLVTSSIKERIAAIFPQVMQTIEKIEPMLNQADGVKQNNEQIVTQLQEVIGTVTQKQTPQPEQTEAFTPEAPVEEAPVEEGFEPPEGIPEGEVEEAEAVEEGLPAEEAPEEEGGEPVAEEAVAEEEPVEEEPVEEEPVEEAVAEEEPIEKEEPAEEPTPKTEPAPEPAETETTEEVVEEE